MVGVAVLVHDPAGRHGFAAVAGQADFAGGDGGGGHIQQHRAGQVAGDADADRVGAKAAGAAAKGGYGFGAGAGVGGEQGNHSFPGAYCGVVAQASDVALAADGESGDAVLFGLGDGHPGSPFGDDEAEAPVAVDNGGGGGFGEHLKGGAGYDVAAVNALAVFGDVDDAVGVVSDEVGLDLVGGDDFGFGVGGAFGAVDGGGGLVQIFGGEGGHWGYLRGLVGMGRMEPGMPVIVAGNHPSKDNPISSMNGLMMPDSVLVSIMTRSFALVKAT